MELDDFNPGVLIETTRYFHALGACLEGHGELSRATARRVLVRLEELFRSATEDNGVPTKLI